MSKRKFNTFWKEMTVDHKINVIGSLATIISLFFPWYSDVDNFGSGDVFIGLNGPLYGAGFSILFIASISFIVSILNSIHFKRQKFKGLYKNLKKFPLMIGIVSFYLIFLTNSIYFHPQFGLNVIAKESGAGVLIALLGAGIITSGGFLLTREKKTQVEQEEKFTGSEQFISEFSPAFQEVETLRKAAGLQRTSEAVAKIYQEEKEPITETGNTQDAVREKKYQPYRMDL